MFWPRATLLETRRLLSTYRSPCLELNLSSFRDSFRLPQPFTERLQNLKARYTSDVRGHDFLSHTGRWTDGNNQGSVDATTASLTEIEGLKSLARENRRRGYDGADMKVSLGPDQGSYFADTYRLGRYHYDKLPSGLNFEVQKEIGRVKYGKITDVAMNGAGGWVMQFDVGDLKMALSKFLGKKKGFEHYRFGGELPKALKEALRQGQDRGAKIMVRLLNILLHIQLTEITAHVPKSPKQR